MLSYLVLCGTQIPIQGMGNVFKDMNPTQHQNYTEHPRDGDFTSDATSGLDHMGPVDLQPIVQNG